ncbi:uncharacterized protein LOC123682119 [Harmonia axyridis]|uniref:uncharacterized protein LOC123682119 n=1 Tax=Harmonia axyridis TaxID=115357 RepID=UPI001E27873C|nr:uncharacterized protein LOC123682119 [Harmonia axyridis]
MYKMDSESRTFYYIVIFWVLLVLLGSILQRCCAYRELQNVYTSYLYGDTGPPIDYFDQGNETGSVRCSEILITRIEGGPSVKTNEFDKPPSYDEDLPTYNQAIEMEKKIKIHRSKEKTTSKGVV